MRLGLLLHGMPQQEVNTYEEAYNFNFSRANTLSVNEGLKRGHKKPNELRMWWVADYKPLEDIYASPERYTKIPKNGNLVLCLSRRRRQIVGEVRTSVGDGEGLAVSTPVTTFTASWIAQLLGYSKRYRGSRVVETFTAIAIRSYLLLYPFTPLSLLIKGPVSNFNYIWSTLNSPAGQVFTHPLTGALVWDIKNMSQVSGGVSRIKEILAGAFEDACCDADSVPDEAVFEAEAHAIAGSLGERWKTRYKLTWHFIFFAPTAFNKPRRPKKARSIKKRLTKRLVKAVGHRFWCA